MKKNPKMKFSINIVSFEYNLTFYDENDRKFAFIKIFHYKISNIIT